MTKSSLVEAANEVVICIDFHSLRYSYERSHRLHLVTNKQDWTGRCTADKPMAKASQGNCTTFMLRPSCLGLVDANLGDAILGVR